MSLSSRLTKSVIGGVIAAAALTTAAPAHAWWEADYAYRTRINLNTTAAGITGEVMRAPVLVRLHSGNFNFADVKPDGADLRFVAGDDRTPLKFHIEKWSPAEEQALIWVDVQNIQPGQASAIYAYYGNENGEAAQDVAGTFGPDYRLVYHFNNEGPPQDATANGANASGGEARNTGGLIGDSLVLSGTAPVMLPASAFSAEQLSVSFWVKPQGDGTIFALPGSISLVSEGGQLFIDQTDVRSAGAPLEAGSWKHVALANDGMTTTLYLDGQPAGTVDGALGAASGTPMLGDGFAGEIDEFRVAGTALAASAFQLAAASEGQASRLVVTDTAEQVETGGAHNNFSVLFKALTFDAWVVIILLAFMLAISIWIMISKGLMIGRVRNGNGDFLDAYTQAAGKTGEHAGLPAVNGGGDGPMARIYNIGRHELEKRLKEGRVTGSRFAIRANSVAAIRSALDAGRTRIGQRLHNRMVLLTIAIAGGPFIGLLGTVLGVMITFSDVAAAGEVNINAIAPGIAAALLATVAGLAVAIPALFGYNYLISRIQEIDTDHELFVDELEKRIAETWQDTGPADRPGGQSARAIAAAG